MTSAAVMLPRTLEGLALTVLQRRAQHLYSTGEYPCHPDDHRFFRARPISFPRCWCRCSLFTHVLVFRILLMRDEADDAQPRS